MNFVYCDTKMADAHSIMVRTAKPVTAANEEGEGAFALEGFEPRAKLGRGACGATYEARRVSDGRTLVLKVLTRKFAKHPRTLAAILNELLPAKGFDDPNAVALRDVLEVSGR